MYLVFEDFDFASGSSANTTLNGIGIANFEVFENLNLQG